MAVLILALVVCAYAAPVEDAEIEADLESLETNEEQDLASEEELVALVQSLIEEQVENAALQEFFAEAQVPVELQGGYKKFFKTLGKGLKKFGKGLKKYGKYTKKLAKKYGPKLLKYGFKYGVPAMLG